MSDIVAYLEGSGWEETFSYPFEELLSHNNLTDSAFFKLPDMERISLAEDYALWAFARKYGNNEEIRVDLDTDTLPIQDFDGSPTQHQWVEHIRSLYSEDSVGSKECFRLAENMYYEHKGVFPVSEKKKPTF